jgi:hypothetical protein
LAVIRPKNSRKVNIRFPRQLLVNVFLKFLFKGYNQTLFTGRVALLSLSNLPRPVVCPTQILIT